MSDWAEDLLQRGCDRVTAVEAVVGDRFPLYREAPAGEWVTTARGSWVGGFWAGLLALRAAATGLGDPAPVRRRLAGWAEADTVCRGMIFWYGGGGLGSADPGSAMVADRLAEAFDPALGAIPWGTALAPDGPAVRPDGAAGVVPLLAAHGHHDIARPHLLTHLRQASTDWQRGRAWLLLSCVDGMGLGGDFRRLAADLAAEWSAPFDPSDSSAAAIAAVALLKSGHPAGERLLRGLTAPGGARYDGRTGLEVVWGDYFTALGAAIVVGLVEPDQW